MMRKRRRERMRKMRMGRSKSRTVKGRQRESWRRGNIMCMNGNCLEMGH